VTTGFPLTYGFGLDYKNGPPGDFHHTLKILLARRNFDHLVIRRNHSDSNYAIVSRKDHMKNSAKHASCPVVSSLVRRRKKDIKKVNKPMCCPGGKLNSEVKMWAVQT